MRGLGTRLALFLYGAPNIFGCLCALCVLLLYFTGIIGNGWLYLTLGAWFAGWLAVPRRKMPICEQLGEAGLAEAMDLIVAEYGHRLPHESIRQLEQIQTVVRDLASYDSGARLQLDADLELSNIVTRDLPTALQSYLALPVGFSHFHPVLNGKTARVLLQEQLVLFHEGVSGIAASLYAQDTTRLASQSEGLRQRLQALQVLPGK